MDEHEEAVLRSAPLLRRRRMHSGLLGLLYAFGMFGALALLPWQANLVAVPVYGALMVVDLRATIKHVRLAQAEITEVVQRIRSTIVLDALGRYAIDEFTLDEPWTPEAVLALAGKTDAPPPTATVVIGNQHRITAAVFYDPTTCRTSLIGSNAAEHDLLDLVRRTP